MFCMSHQYKVERQYTNPEDPMEGSDLMWFLAFLIVIFVAAIDIIIVRPIVFIISLIRKFFL